MHPCLDPTITQDSAATAIRSKSHDTSARLDSILYLLSVTLYVNIHGHRPNNETEERLYSLLSLSLFTMNRGAAQSESFLGRRCWPLPHVNLADGRQWNLHELGGVLQKCSLCRQCLQPKIARHRNCLISLKEISAGTAEIVKVP